MKHAPEIMDWSAKVYHDAFHKSVSDGQTVNLQAQDYMIGDRKFGGNAQCVTRNRFVHHTSLLYDYDVRNMDFLRMPPKVPEHRRGREHKDFICPLKTYFPHSDGIMDAMIDSFRRTKLLEHCVEVPSEDILTVDEQEFWCRTKELITTDYLQS